MVSPRWREQLRQELHRQQLPSEYVDRLVEELADHAADLSLDDQSTDSEPNANARLGTPEQLAAVAKIEYQRRTFAGRHPFLMFVAGPVPVVIGTLLVTLLIATHGFWWIDVALGGSFGTDAPRSSLEIGILQVLNVVVRFVPFALCAWLFVHLGRQSSHRAWSSAACGLVAIVGLFFFAGISREPAPGRAGWYFGFDSTIGLDRIVQAAVPLGLGIWMLWHFLSELAARFRGHNPGSSEHSLAG